MSLLESIILAIVQGISEFLPISSSGHVSLASYLLNITPSLTLNVFLNTATFLSVLFYFKNNIKDFFSKLPYIIVGSIPAGIVGVLVKTQFNDVFSSIDYLPIFFLITSVILSLTKVLPNRSMALTYPKALLIGLFQAMAIMPGVSRSASTIFASLAMGLSPLEAFKFSFYLFIPASAGALLLEYKDMVSQPGFISLNSLIAFAVAFLVGVAALKVLQKILATRKIWIFAPYVFILSLILYLSRF